MIRRYTVRCLQLDAIQSDAMQYRLEWYWSTALWGSLSNIWIPYIMATTNAWWPSQFLLSFDEWPGPEMARISRKLSTRKFSVPSIFRRLVGIWKYLHTKITNSKFCRHDNFTIYVGTHATFKSRHKLPKNAVCKCYFMVTHVHTGNNVSPRGVIFQDQCLHQITSYALRHTYKYVKWHFWKHSN